MCDGGRNGEKKRTDTKVPVLAFDACPLVSQVTISPHMRFAAVE